MKIVSDAFNLGKSSTGSLTNFIIRLGSDWATEFRRSYLKKPEHQVPLDDLYGLKEYIGQIKAMGDFEVGEAAFAVGVIVGGLIEPKDKKVLKILDQVKARLNQAELLPKGERRRNR